MKNETHTCNDDAPAVLRSKLAMLQANYDHAVERCKVNYDAVAAERDAARAEVRTYQELHAATDAYMNQPGMSCYAKKSDWRADSDIRGQRVHAALDVLAASTGTECAK